MRLFQKRSKKTNKDLALLSMKQLEDLPYADEFDLPDEEGKLRALYEYESAGAEGGYDIRKVFNSKGMGARTVMTVDDFPTLEKLEELVEAMYGGGIYRIHPAGSPRVFKTYHVDGPPRFLVGEPKEKTPGLALKEKVEEAALAYLKDELDRGSEVGERLTMAYLEKSLSIQLPKEPTQEEKIFLEALDTDSKFRRQYVEDRLRKLGGKKRAEHSELGQLIAELKDYGKLKPLLGSDAGAGGGLRDILKEVAQGLKEITSAVSPKPSKTGGEVSQSGPTQQAAATQTAAASASPGPPSPPSPTISWPRPSSVTQETVPLVASVPRRPEPVPAEPPKTPPEAATEPDQEVDWGSLLSQVDWAEVEKAVHSDPEEFIQQTYDSALDGQDGSHQALTRLFHDLEPPAILDVLSHAVESMAAAAGKGEEYEVAVLVVKHLTETEAGRAWLAKAHIAAGAIQDRRLQMEQGRAMIEGWKARGGDPAFEDMSQNADAEIDGPVLI